MMTPIFFNSSSNNYSPYPNDFDHEDHLSNPFVSSNSQASSSSNSLTSNMFLNSTIHDQNRIFDTELHPPQHQQQGNNIFGSRAYNHQTENNDKKGVEFFTWNKGELVDNNINNDENQVKWMSSKMRVMLKIKRPNPMNLNTNYTSTTREVTKLDQDHKPPTSPMEETSNSSNSTSSNNNIPIRVCSDCNTTKTPLWRSGPRGPKSLCNACGIRQRKARRALAAAAAENGNINASIDRSFINPLKVKKTHHKDHKKPSNGYVTKYKKRQYSKQITTTITIPTPSPSPSPSPSPPRKNCVEEFLVSLSKNLSFYRVFPQDEKEAAILLMALSCGYAHEA